MVLEEGLHDSDDKQSKTSQMELGREWSQRAKGIMGFVVFPSGATMSKDESLEDWMVTCFQLASHLWGHF